MTTYTITDDSGAQVCASQEELFDALTMRGWSALEILLVIGELVSKSLADRCGCGDADCLHLAAGYPWCRPCGEHHRAPECAVDGDGVPLAPCGHPWDYEHADGER